MKDGGPLLTTGLIPPQRTNGSKPQRAREEAQDREAGVGAAASGANRAARHFGCHKEPETHSQGGDLETFGERVGAKGESKGR